MFGASVVAFFLSFLQTPGRLAADTKYDLTQNPIGFLERAAHQWSSQAPMGQVQNQAYGYFFPHGAFFALGDVLSIPPWITQRVWWALLLVAGFWGIVRLAEALGVGSRSSRVIAGIAFAFSPRVLTTLGSISSETLPMMLAPWVLLPLVVAFGNPSPAVRCPLLSRSPARLAAQSALAVALMGAVNAVATVAACLVAGLWWISHRPNRRWWTFTVWWFPFLALATLWWIVPLLLLGKVSPPFLDYIESSGVTTQWTSLAEILRGTDSWTPFVSPSASPVPSSSPSPPRLPPPESSRRPGWRDCACARCLRADASCSSCSSASPDWPPATSVNSDLPSRNRCVCSSTPPAHRYATCTSSSRWCGYRLSSDSLICSPRCPCRVRSRRYGGAGRSLIPNANRWSRSPAWSSSP